jgi:hypothetical protein
LSSSTSSRSLASPPRDISFDVIMSTTMPIIHILNHCRTPELYYRRGKGQKESEAAGKGGVHT